MDKNKVIETSGQDIEEAVDAGLEKLGVARDQVDVEIIDEGRRGLLGIGGREAVVRLSVRSATKPKPAPVKTEPKSEQSAVERVETETAAQPTPPVSQPKEKAVLEVIVPPAEEIDTAVSVVDELLGLMSVQATVSSHLSEPDDLTGRQLAILDIEGEDLNVLIGPRGETLGALQYVSRLMVGHRLQQRAHFVIDVDGYRDRRQLALTRLAERMAGKAVKRGSSVTLEAMPAHERRLIHMALRDSSEVRTESMGEGKRRRVRIYLK